MSDEEPKGRRPRQRRTPKRRVRDTLLISQLYKDEGKTQAQIATDLGISTSTVNRALKELEVQWKADAAKNYDLWKMTLRNEVLFQLEQAYEAWFKSKEPRSIDSSKLTDGADGKKREISKRVEERPGNPAFLSAARESVAQLMKLTGLDIQKVAPVNPDGTEPYQPTFSLEDFGNIIDQVRQFEGQLKDGRSNPAG